MGRINDRQESAERYLTAEQKKNTAAFFANVLAKHILADVLGDRDEMCDLHRFTVWLNNREPKLNAAFNAMLEKFHVENIESLGN